MGGFLSSASFISCITHYNFVPHSGPSSSLYCFHFIRFPLLFLLKAPVLFSTAPSLHLSDSPVSYRGGGRWEEVPTVPRHDWLFLARCFGQLFVCVWLCVLFRIHLINQHNSHSPKGPSHDFIDAWPFRNQSCVLTWGHMIGYLSSESGYPLAALINAGWPRTWISALTCPIAHLFQGAAWICHTLQISSVVHSPEIAEWIQKLHLWSSTACL